MTASYRFDPNQSRLSVRAFATGLLSFAGHSPTFEARDFRGEARFERGGTDGMALELAVDGDHLALVGSFSDSDRREIETRMARDVLQVASYPEITFQAAEISRAPIAPGRSRLRINGQLSLHGVTRDHPVEAELQVLDDALRLLGESSLRLSDFRIAPVTALGGTIRLMDELKLSFDVIGLRESS